MSLTIPKEAKCNNCKHYNPSYSFCKLKGIKTRPSNSCEEWEEDLDREGD